MYLYFRCYFLKKYLFVAFHYFFKINAYIIYNEISKTCTLINDSLK